MYKVLVVGDTNTGKTSLVNRVVNNTFSDRYQVTIQCEFGTKILDVDGEAVNLQLWDIAGQDRLASSMTKVFCRGAQGALLVFDLTDASTLQATLSWAQRIGEHIDPAIQAPLFLVGNKSDLPPAVSEEEVQRFVKENGLAGYELTSAKTGINTEQVLISLAKRLLKKPEVEKVIEQKPRGVSLHHPKAEPASKKQGGCCK